MDNSSKQKKDPDKAFLISLLPDYNKLNEDEKIDFRLLTLQFFQSIRRKKSQNLQPNQLPQVPYLSSQQSVMNPSFHFQKYPDPLSTPDMQSPLHVQTPLHMEASFHQMQGLAHMQAPSQLMQAPPVLQASPVLQAPSPVQAPSPAQTPSPAQGTSMESPTPM